MKKLWYSLFERGEYKSDEPAFIEPHTLRFTSILEDNFDIIKAEFWNYSSANNLKTYFNSTMVEQQNSWKTVSVITWGIKMYENFKYFPKTLALIKSIDGVVSVSFSYLEAGGKIKPHCGDTNGIYRCHLPIKVPGPIPMCGFRVKDEWRSWEEGKLLVFIDANPHEAINLTPDGRYIMIIDVIRSEVRSKKGWICATVRTSLFLQRIAERVPLLYKLPIIAQFLIAVSLIPCAYVAIPLRNLLYAVIKQ